MHYAILAQTSISSVPASSIITGSIVVPPISATAITDFSWNQVTGQDWSTSTQVTAKVYAPEYSLAIRTKLNTAVGDMQTAYNDTAGRVADATLSTARSLMNSEQAI